MPFSTLASLPPRAIFPGVTGRYAHGGRFTVGEVTLDASAVVKSHEHPHDQITYVIEGRVEFTVGAETTIMAPGTCALIPGNTPHGCRALTACRLVDVFTPVRDDYR
jgi:quercetin dioxygenase-like cupin family protein